MKPIAVFFILILNSCLLVAIPATIDNHIKIDQFGYQCNGQKIAIISNPITGYNNASPFSPGTGANQYQIRRWSDDAIQFTGTLTAWNGGATHTQSGDQAWWFDFSTFVTPGEYYVFDIIRNVASYKFRIGDDVYKDVLKAAVKSFYYQRCGVPKLTAYTTTAWADPACHLQTTQDPDCRLYNNTIPATSKNLSGGWHDAGDYNKYVNFTWSTLIDLLTAYEENPTIWADDYVIPESGNGIPDLLDEIKFETDWLLKMQQGDGSVLSIVGEPTSGAGGGAYSPPSVYIKIRRYGPATTSASLTTSAVFALAAIQFNTVGMTAYATTLQTASVNAWNWAVANPNVTWNNSGNISAGEQEVNAYGLLSRKVSAACFLYALTGQATYKSFFDANYNQIHLIQWSYAYCFEHTEQDILLYYTKIPGADVTISNAIKTNYNNSIRVNNTDNLPSFTGQSDAYRSFLRDNNFTWGSNSTKSKQGEMFYNMLTYNLDAANQTNYRNAASGFIHHMHGVNPNALVYLSNMNGIEAENSVNEFYHSWFTDGSALWDRVGTSTYGPAPGFLTGGPNPTWSLDGCCPSGCGSPGNNALCVTLTPPSGQPHQKSYRDWNTNWPQNSWSITENGIYYQSAYIKLLSKFIGNSCGSLPISYLNFTATLLNENDASISWNALEEENITSYTLEKSTNGIEFSPITSFVATKLSYSFIDKNIQDGTSYYRLKINKTDNTYLYSIVKQLSKNKNIDWKLFPIPASNKIFLQNKSNASTAIHVEIISLQGIIQFKTTFEKNKNIEELDVSSLKPGMYLIRIKEENQSSILKFTLE